jgi:hypothetical protein
MQGELFVGQPLEDAVVEYVLNLSVDSVLRKGDPLLHRLNIPPKNIVQR